MTIIIGIIVLVALVCLYDYFSAKNWQQVTSVTRNEVVFEKRNKRYGAYVIREGYNRRMILIMLGLVGSVGAAYATFVVVRTVPMEEKTLNSDGFILDTLYMDLTKEKEDETQKEDDKTTAPTKEEIVKFVEPVVTDDKTIIDVIKPVEGEIAIGEEDQKGKDGFGPKLIVDEIDSTIHIGIPPTGGGIVEDVDEQPQFPGGHQKMMEFLAKNLMYPETAVDGNISGKCYLRFVVNKEGKISGARVTRDIDDCPECGREAVRVINKMPKWRPGRVKGQAVDSYFDMPVNFVLR